MAAIGHFDFSSFAKFKINGCVKYEFAMDIDVTVTGCTNTAGQKNIKIPPRFVNVLINPAIL